MVQQLSHPKSVHVESKAEVVYPDSDGQPMSDNTLQFQWIVTIKENLELMFADKDDVFIAGDLLWYPVEGNNKIRQAPDAMVAFGRPKGYRGSYMQWKEDNIPPQVVFEVLSPGNRRTEMLRKVLFYEHHGVEEYYEYDPYNVELTGCQRRDGKLEALDTVDGWTSPRLGIRFAITAETLEIYQPDNSRFLTFTEIGQRLNETSQQLETTQSELETTQSELETTQSELEVSLSQNERMAAKLKELGIDPSSM